LSAIPDFTSVAWQQKHTDAELTVHILDGRGTGMPAFSDRLSPAEVSGLVAYVRSLNAADGNAAQSAPALDLLAKRPADDEFEKRFRQLQEELKELRRQFRELAETSSP
jgi:mono/diheme cytochrome c family protein